MHDFIEKPSRLILFIIGVIALVTIIILLSRSNTFNSGGQPLVNFNGKLTVTPSAVPQDEDAAEDDDTDQYEDYDEEYDGDNQSYREEDDGIETEDPDALQDNDNGNGSGGSEEVSPSSEDEPSDTGDGQEYEELLDNENDQEWY